jgi:hypothetical protein
MAHCSNTSRSLMTGEWSERSSDSDSLNTIYWTFAFKLPIMRPNSKACCRLKPHQRGIWNSPTLTTLRQTSMSLVPPILKEAKDLLTATTNNGVVWNPSRWGHLV